MYESTNPRSSVQAKTLADLGADPHRRPASRGDDLRRDWPTALRGAGLDPTQPTAWNGEGCFVLPPDAQDALLDNITQLSAAGSRLATENMPDASQACR